MCAITSFGEYLYEQGTRVYENRLFFFFFFGDGKEVKS